MCSLLYFLSSALRLPSTYLYLSLSLSHINLLHVTYRYESLVYNEMNGLENLFLTSTIVDTELSVGPFTGHELAHCFGFTDQVCMCTYSSSTLASILEDTMYVFIARLLRRRTINCTVFELLLIL